MEFRILGQLEVMIGGSPVEVGGEKPKSVLALLLLHANEVVSAERMINDVWHCPPTARARGTLQVNITRLRKLLDSGRRIETRPPGYRLRAQHTELDTLRFEELLGEATALRDGNPAPALTVLDEALALWRGQPLSEFDVSLESQTRIDGLNRRRLEAVEERARIRVLLGMPQEAVSDLQILVGEYPDRDVLWALLLLALYRCGRQAEVVKAYLQRAEEMAGIGLAPWPDFQQLYQRILRQDPGLLSNDDPLLRRLLDIDGFTPSRELGTDTRTTQGQRPRSSDLDEVTRDLAVVVRSQWRREETLRRVHDPFPLPVRWTVVDEDVMDHWANIRRAGRGPGDGDPIDLSGELDHLVEVYQRIPSGRMVILGKAGAGKTTLCLRFVLDHIKVSQRVVSVPVLFNLGSWDPSKTSLRDWMITRLIFDYPALSAHGRRLPTLAADLVEDDRVLPVLDGFDEMTDALRGDAIRALNATTMPLLLTSRTTEFGKAVCSADVITAAAVVVLADLAVADLTAYLPRTARPAGWRENKWNPVLEHLRVSDDTDHTKAVLSNPLMVSLARAIYSDIDDRDPAELTDSRRFPDAQALEDHLLAAFTQAVYLHPPLDQRHGPRHHWTFAEAERGLAFLAGHLNRRHATDLAWWELRDAVPVPVRVILVGLIFGLVSGLAFGYHFGVISGLMAGIAAGGKRGSLPSRTQLRVRGRAGHIARAVASNVLIGTAIGISAGLVVHFAFGGYGIGPGIIYGPSVGLAFGLVAGLYGPMDIRATVEPSTVLAIDRRNTVFRMLVVGLIGGVAGGLVGWVTGVLPDGAADGPKVALVAALGVGLGRTAWGQWLATTRVWLPVTRRLPWSLIAFLNDAHRRGVLRQSGAVYQFRHTRLQRATLK